MMVAVRRRKRRTVNSYTTEDTEFVEGKETWNERQSTLTFETGG